MKKILFAALLLLGSMRVFAQQILIEDHTLNAGDIYLGPAHNIKVTPPVSNPPTPSFAGIQYFYLTFTPIGGSSFTSCGVGVDSDVPSAWNTGGAVPSQNCASAGSYSSPSAVTANRIRLNAGAVGNGTVRVQLWGCFSTCSSTGGAVSSVSNSDSTLTISPTTGAVVGSLNLAHANTWSAAQTFGNVIGTGTIDFSGSTIFKTRVGAGLTSSANGDFGFDSTSLNFHGWNGADAIFAPLATGFVSGDCGQPTSSGGKWTIVDAGSGCGTSGVSSLATSTTNSVGLTVTPSATSGSNIKEEVTGASPSFGTSVTAPLFLLGGSVDTGLSRDSAGVVDVGNGTGGNKSGTLQAATVNATTSVSVGASPPTACGSATGCVAFAEASTAGTPTAGQDYIRWDSTAHQAYVSLNGVASFISALNWTDAIARTQVAGVGLTAGDTLNFNASTPAAGSNGKNVTFQTSNSGGVDSVSGEIVGDGNSGHCLSGTGTYVACSSGGATIYAYWSPTGNGASANSSAVAQNTTMLWGFVTPLQITSSTGICYTVGVIDNSANLYDIGVYDTSGNLEVHTGATAGTTLFNTTTLHCVNWTASGPIIAGRKYLALTSSAASPLAKFLIAGSQIQFASAVAPSSGSTTSSGVLNSSVTPAADSWGTGTQMVTFNLH